MPIFNTIIFDLDGVVIDSRQVIKKVFEHAYKKVVGVGKPPFDQFKKYLGQGLPVILEKLGLPIEMKDVFVQESYRLAHQIKVFEGIPGLLSSLSDNHIFLGIATGKDGKRARSLLSQLGLLSYFNLVLGSDEVTKGKPAPDIVTEHLKYFHSDPQQTLMIGDSISDMRAGKAACVSVAAALWGIEENDKLINENPDYVLIAPGDLFGVLGLEPEINYRPAM
jgi:AHBA synthesis associated protein